MRKFIQLIILFSILATTGCGFKPLYKTESMSFPLKVGSLKFVDAYFDKHLYVFSKALEDSLNPSQIHANYRLDVNIVKQTYNIDTQNNSVNNRTKILLIAQYTLTDLRTDKVIVTDSAYSADSFDITVSPYSTYISEEQSIELLLRNLADEIKIRIIEYLH